MPATGNVRYSQLRSGDRLGSGTKIPTTTVTSPTANAPLLYDASGNIIQGSRSGNSTQFATITGTKTTGKQLAFDSDGNVVASGSNIGGGSSIGETQGPSTEPVNGDFSWLNQGGSTLYTSSYGIVLTVPGGTVNWRGRIRAVPTAPYTVTVCLQMGLVATNFANAGLILYDGTALIHYGITQGSNFVANRWNSVTSFNGSYTPNTFLKHSPYMWLQIEDDNTNRRIRYSPAGHPGSWMELLSTGRTDFFTPTHIGFAGDSENSLPVIVHLLSWEEA